MPLDESGGEIRSGRYVAVVPEDRPWREPLLEATVASGRPVPRWSLEPGRYGLVCMARGFGLALVPGVELGEGSAVDLPCRPRRSIEGSGRVVDARTRRPVEGALVSLAGHFRLGADSRLLSPVGMEFLRPLVSARTGDDGAFRLSGQPGGRALAWIEAEGFAPMHIPLLAFPDRDGGSLGTHALSSGGQLVVNTSIPEAFPLERYRMVLRASDLVWPLPETYRGPLLPEQAEARRGGAAAALWSRPLLHSGPNRWHWPSLPAGSYQVWLKGAAFGSHEDLPVELGTVRVAPGEISSLLAEVAWQPPESRGTRGVDDLRVLVRETRLGSGSIHGQSLAGDSLRHHEAVAERVSGGTLVRVAAGCRRGASISILGERAVSPAVEAREGDCTEDSSLATSWIPAADALGELRTPRGIALPASGRFWCTTGEETVGPFLAEVDVEGSLRSRVPETCDALTFDARGFAQLRWERIRSADGAPIDLGSRRLQPGSSVLARVISSHDGAPLGGATVELIESVEVLGVLAAGAMAELGPRPLRATTGHRGWVRLAGVEAGTYVARVSGAGLEVPTFVKPFAVGEASEVILDDIETEPAATVLLQVEDRVGYLKPGDAVSVNARTNVASCGFLSAARLEAHVPRDGPASGFEIELPPLMAGDWEVTLTKKDHLGDTHRLGLAHFTVHGGEESEVSLSLEGRYFRGTVTHRGEPVEARLSFVPTVEGVSGARTRSDVSGEFEVPLTEPGIYDVEVNSREQGLSLIVPDQVFEDSEQDVEIRIPEASIAGRVVHADGEPATDAVVIARPSRRLDAPSRAEADAGRPATRRRDAGAFAEPDGSFEILGMGEGLWSVRASIRGQRSRSVAVELSDDEAVGGLLLRLEPGARLRGRLHVAGHAVASAQGQVLPLAHDLREPDTGRVFRSGPDGSFDLELTPGPHGEVNIVIIARGWPLQAFREDLT
ncbi:MAG: carboxypeptidase-like regulatory domain-containing protein, partial [Holophagales bacterium]|nr:carboxypeptidase-like regulatory domain-containing protein [Holophagales bacterium]